MYSGVPLIERSSSRAGDQPGDAEVDDLDEVDAGAALIDDDVVGLEVGVDDAGEVRLFDPGERLHHDVDHALDRERVLGDEQLGQRRPLDVLHREIEQAIGRLAVIDDRDAVGVIEPRRAHRLVAEPLDHPRVGGQVLVQDLDGDGAAERDLVRAIHRAAAADPDTRRELELLTEDAPDELQRLVDLILDLAVHVHHP